MARFVIDYTIGCDSGFVIEAAETAQEAVDSFYSYMPPDEEIIIDGVYKEVKNWRARA